MIRCGYLQPKLDRVQYHQGDRGGKRVMFCCGEQLWSREEHRNVYEKNSLDHSRLRVRLHGGFHPGMKLIPGQLGPS